MKNQALIIIAIIVTAIIVWPDKKIDHGPGIVAPMTPVQTNLTSSASFTHKNYTITPLATFYIQAKVLGKERYYIDRESELAPIDLALGWGKMSDDEVLKHFSISQSGRWYRWNTDNFVIPRREVETSSANMHLIPANDKVKTALSFVNEGDVVSIQGKLVSVKGEDGWGWKSSLTREDTGNGACELIWVESITVK